MPDHAITFAGGVSATILDPIVLCALIVAVILILLLARKYVILPVFCMMFLVPGGEQLFVGGVHLYIFRIVILVGMFRMLWAKSTSQTPILSGGINSIDWAFILCTICEACAVVLLFASSSALINQFGFLVDYLGGYFLLRFLIRDEDDIYRTVKCLAFLALIVGACMVMENVTLHNVFASIGGQAIPEIRDGRVRSQGPFEQELMAGAFGATLLPLCLLLWKNERAKTAATCGLVGAVLMTWTSNSSTSLLSFGAGILAILFWPIRKKMRTVRWGIVIGLVALQVVMKAPIWYVIAHIDLTGGSSSYHRAELINQFITHFSDWWLIGVRATGSWGLDMWDAQNQFVDVGVTGGLLALIFFIAMISRSFRELGNARKAVEGDAKKEWLLWLLGAALFSHVVTFFGVNYFDQTKFVWFALLAMIAAATVPLHQTSEVLERQANVAYSSARWAYSSQSRSRSMATRVDQKARAQLKSTIS
jgi:hypothetical protein